MPATTADLVQKFIHLHHEIKHHSEEIETKQAELKILGADLLGRFERAEINTMGSLGNTIYIRRQLWPKNVTDSQATVLALKASGLDDLVSETPNSNRLAAYVREVGREHEEGGLPLNCEQIREFLPQPLREAIEVTEKVSLQIRRS
jgi:UDP-N-acetylglucosamine enolpyruvyl transferase